MTIKEKAALRQPNSCVQILAGSARHFTKATLLGALLALATGGAGTGAQAQTAPELKPYVVKNDRGGFIRTRLAQLRTLRASGQPVQIRGQVCYSTCTMLLGLPNTCVSPKTEFGFHGPSKMGRPLPPDRFEYFSQVIAQYYPEPLRNWYMKTGRNRFGSLYRISGSTIIRLGVKSCEEQGV